MAFNGKIAALNRKLRTSKTPFADVFFHLRATPNAELIRTLRDLRAVLPSESLLFGNPFPQNFSELLDWTNLFQGEPGRDLLVASAEISLFSSEINKFVALQGSFDRSILAKDYGKAHEVLAAVEKSFGVSLWLLESRLSLLELHRGVEEQKRYMNALLEDPNVSPTCKTLIYMFSVKAERNVTSERYLTTLAGKFPFPPKTPYVPAHYLYFHLGFYALSFQRFDLHTVLLFERGSSIIDRYLTLIRICQLAVAGYSTNLRPHLAVALRFIENRIRDHRLDNLRTALGRNSEENLHHDADSRSRDSFLEILDLYTSGRYEELLNEDGDSLNDAELGALFDVVVRANARSSAPPKGTILLRFELVAEPYASLLAKRSVDATPFEYLLKVIQMFSKSDFSAELFNKLLAEMQRGNAVEAWDSQIFADLNGSCYSPKLVSKFVDKLPAPRQNVDLKAIKASITYRFFNSFDRAQKADNTDALPIPKARLLRYRAHKAIQDGDLQLAEQCLYEVLSIGDSLDKQDAGALLIRTLLNSGCVADAAKLTATILTENLTWHLKIPLLEVMTHIEAAPKDARRGFRRSVYVSVCYGLYGLFFGSDKDELKTISVEEFLSETGAHRPSNLQGTSIDVTPRILIFFLQNVCRIDTLDSHIEYESTSDVENERIRILLWLIELDEKQKSQYTDEIAAIAQKQLLLKGVQTVDKSKIYVDVEGVKATTTKDLPDLYLRFQSLPNHGSTNVNDLVLQLSKTLSSKGGGLVKFVVPRNERLAALRDFYLAVRDRFVSSNEYGLDVYLSVGIRHGTLSGQLRSVFEAEHLVTQKDADGHYAINQYWLRELDLENDDHSDALVAVKDLLCEFSDFVDSNIAILRNSWIQVRTEDRHSDGLFDFRIDSSEIVALNKRVATDMDISEATDLMIAELWSKADASLANIRHLLTTQFKSLFTRKIDACLAELSRVENTADVHRLRNAFITARTRFQNETDDIAAWFTRESRVSTAPFVLSYAVDVALEMIKRCYPQRSLRLDQHIDSDPELSGETLSGMVNVLFFAFDNIMEHCGDVTDPEATIVCKTMPRHLLIEISSRVYRDIDVDIENERLAYLLSDIDKATTSDRVRREGGTGLLKIAKTIRIDFQSALKIEFGYQSAEQFELSLSISNGRIFP